MAVAVGLPGRYVKRRYPVLCYLLESATAAGTVTGPAVVCLFRRLVAGHDHWIRRGIA
jgi:hypothetical protein